MLTLVGPTLVWLIMRGVDIGRLGPGVSVSMAGSVHAGIALATTADAVYRTTAYCASPARSTCPSVTRRLFEA